jgi:hypothetical protein
VEIFHRFGEKEEVFFGERRDGAQRIIFQVTAGPSGQ